MTQRLKLTWMVRCPVKICSTPARNFAGSAERYWESPGELAGILRKPFA
jgi:hypothetical protein